MESGTRTEVQKEASRQNGKSSCGPTSDAGKARSSQNATRHGLYSSRIVLTNESQEDFDSLVLLLSTEWNPIGLTETQLLHDMAVATWKIRRYENMEGAALDTEMFIHQKSFDECFQPADPGMRHHDAATSLHNTAPGLLDFYHRAIGRFHRILSRARKDLERLQTRRLGHPAQLTVTPAQEIPDFQQVPSNIGNEPGPAADPPSVNGKTYREPEQFTITCKVDHTKLNPLAPKQEKKNPHVYDFSKCFKPAA